MITGAVEAVIITYVVFLVSPVQPVLPLGKFLTPMPNPIFDGKLKKGRTIKFPSAVQHISMKLPLTEDLQEKQSMKL